MNRKGYNKHPCLDVAVVSELSFMCHGATCSFIHALCEGHQLLKHPIISHQLPQCCTVNAVECLTMADHFLLAIFLMDCFVGVCLGDYLSVPTTALTEPHLKR